MKCLVRVKCFPVYLENKFAFTIQGLKVNLQFRKKKMLELSIQMFYIDIEDEQNFRLFTIIFENIYEQTINNFFIKSN